ncbi:MAG: hypothetical protein NC453_25195, partial [Muribaculum sp.]|nr:hypothetical protein [Muribaculum sp.]
DEVLVNYMKRVYLLLSMILVCLMVSIFFSCSKDDESNSPSDPNNPNTSMSGSGDYGQLGNNMVATGGTRAVSYTQGILLGTVDFSKLDDTHTFGVVIEERF